MIDPESLGYEAEVAVDEVLAAQYSARCGSDPVEIAAAMGPGFGMLMGFVQQHGLTFAGPPRAIYTESCPAGTSFTLAAPIAALPAMEVPPGPVTLGKLPAAKAMRFVHRGAYRDLLATYDRIAKFLVEKGCMRDEMDWGKYMPMWEEYVNDPVTTPESELVTFIYLPLA